MTCTREELLAFARRAAAYCGAHLYLRVVPEGTPCMNWREVLIPERFTTWSAEEMRQTVLHEWGHRAICPVSPARGAVWRRAAASKAG